MTPVSSHDNRAIRAYLILLLSVLLCVLVASSAGATTVYDTDHSISAQVGGNSYNAASLTVAGATPASRAPQKQGTSGSNFFRPGATSGESSLASIGTSPRGYGWATDFALAGDIPAGTWSFKVTTRNSRSENSPAYVGVNVFSYCGGANTFLFYAQGATNAGGTTANVSQTITSSQPAFTAQGCALKFEYWVTFPNPLQEDNSMQLLVPTPSLFTIDFPTPSGQGEDGPTCPTPTKSATCGVGACQRTITQTCAAGVYSPDCAPGTPIAEICGNGIDDDCDGVIDDPAVCSPPQSNSTNNATGTNLTNSSAPPPVLNATCTPNANRTCIVGGVGACASGSQVCTASGTWGSCAPGTPTKESCNGVDDNCNGQVDEGISVPATCGLGECLRKVTQTCAHGQLTPVCAPATPVPELCNGKDDNCDGTVDEGLTKQCGSNVGECRPGQQSCIGGNWTECIGGIGPAPEQCDFKDDDCDGLIDEGSVCSSNATAAPCHEEWTCGNWTSCGGKVTSTRVCTDLHSCGTTNYLLATSRLCRYANLSAQGTAELSYATAIYFNERTVLYSLSGGIVIGALVAITLFVLRKPPTPPES